MITSYYKAPHCLVGNPQTLSVIWHDCAARQATRGVTRRLSRHPPKVLVYVEKPCGNGLMRMFVNFFCPPPKQGQTHWPQFTRLAAPQKQFWNFPLRSQPASRPNNHGGDAAARSLELEAPVIIVTPTVRHTLNAVDQGIVISLTSGIPKVHSNEKTQVLGVGGSSPN